MAYRHPGIDRHTLCGYKPRRNPAGGYAVYGVGVLQEYEVDERCLQSYLAAVNGISRPNGRYANHPDKGTADAYLRKYEDWKEETTRCHNYSGREERTE